MSEITQQSECACKRLSSDQLELTLSYLMSRFAVKQDKQVAKAVLHHLEILLENLNTEKESSKKDHYLRLYNMWYMDVYGAGIPNAASAGIH